MLPIFKMQVQHILRGKRKWFVVLLLLMPVLLTYVAMEVGGLGELKRTLEKKEETAGEPDRAADHPPLVRGSRRRVVVTDEPREFANGTILVTRDGVIYNGRNVPEDWHIDVNEGYLVIEDGYAWLDESKKREGAGLGIRITASALSMRGSLDVAWEVVVAIYLFLLYPQVACLLLALFYGSSLLGTELENKTLTYLFTRPVKRWRIITGKYLAIVCVLIPPTAVSLSISWMLMGATSVERILPGVLAGAAGGIIAYNAVFVLLGFIAPKRAMVLALMYGVVFEFILSFVPALVNEFTITYYLRSLVVGITDLEVPGEIARIVGGASFATSLLALGGIVVLALVLSSLLAGRREYVVADQ